jgi:hypothetical protein
MLVTSNVFDLSGSAVMTYSGDDFSPPITGKYFIFRNNYLKNVVSRVLTAPATTWIHSANVIIADNVCNVQTPGPPGEYGFILYIDPAGGTGGQNVGAGGTWTPPAFTFNGATPGMDQVQILKPSGCPPDFIVTGTVTANNTIQLKMYNPTAVNLFYPGGSGGVTSTTYTRVWIERKMH